MRPGDPTDRGVVAWASAHRRMLGVAAIVSALVALPFVLTAPSDYQSQGQVLIPASDVVASQSGQASALELRLAQYLRNGLPADTREALDRRGEELRSVTAVQLRDRDLYLVTATATSPAAARQAVLEASSTLIGRSNEIAAEQVATLRAKAETQMSQITYQVIGVEDVQRKVATELSSLGAELDHLRGGKHGSAQVIELASLERRLEMTQAEAAELLARHQFLTTQRSALVNVVAEADRDLVTRTSVSVLVSDPTAAGRSAPTRILVTISLAVLIGLTIAAGVAWVVERRRAQVASQDNPLLARLAPSDEDPATGSASHGAGVRKTRER